MSGISAHEQNLRALADILRSPEQARAAFIELANRAEVATKAEDSLKTLRDKLDAQQSEINKSLKDIAERERQFQIAKDSIAARQEQQITKHDELAAREDKVAKGEASISLRSSQIDGHCRVKESELAEREAIIASKEKRLKDKEAELRDKENIVDGKLKQLKALASE